MSAAEDRAETAAQLALLRDPATIRRRRSGSAVGVTRITQFSGDPDGLPDSPPTALASGPRSGNHNRTPAAGRPAPPREPPSTDARPPMPAPALPRIRPVTAAGGRVPDAATLAKLGMSGPCAVERDGDGGPGDDAVAVDADAAGRPRAVALIACGNGAYNFSSAVYLLTLHGGEWRSEPARFDLPSDLYEGLATVVNADLTNELLEIAAYAKGRGLGDCGVAHNWVWDGAMFRLTNMRRMDECRGSLVWPTVWRADIEGR